jgi:hypothetical protein
MLPLFCLEIQGLYLTWKFEIDKYLRLVFQNFFTLVKHKTIYEKELLKANISFENRPPFEKLIMYQTVHLFDMLLSKASIVTTPFLNT